jgi:hypothetical protein
MKPVHNGCEVRVFSRFAYRAAGSQAPRSGERLVLR